MYTSSKVLIMLGLANAAVSEGPLLRSQCMQCYNDDLTICLLGTEESTNYSSAVCCPGKDFSVNKPKCIGSFSHFYCASKIPTAHDFASNK